MVLPVLGFDFMQTTTAMPNAIDKPQATPESPEFEMDAVGVVAKARESQGKFVVMKDSTVRVQGVPSWTSYRQLREQLRCRRDAPAFFFARVSEIQPGHAVR